MDDDDGRCRKMMEENNSNKVENSFLQVVGDGLGTLVGVPMAQTKLNPTQKYNFCLPKKKHGN